MSENKATSEKGICGENYPDWLPEEGKETWREVLPILAEKPWWDPVGAAEKL